MENNNEWMFPRNVSGTEWNIICRLQKTHHFRHLANIHPRRCAVRLPKSTTHAAGQAIRTSAGQGPRGCRGDVFFKGDGWRLVIVWGEYIIHYTTRCIYFFCLCWIEYCSFIYIYCTCVCCSRWFGVTSQDATVWDRIEWFVGATLSTYKCSSWATKKTLGWHSIILVGCPPSQDSSHHQDYEPFLVGDPYKPSFATVANYTGWLIGLLILAYEIIPI